MFAKRVCAYIVAVCVAVSSGPPSTRAQDTAEAARKAKAKNQQQRPDASSSPAPTKPKTYTNDDFPDSGASYTPAGGDIPGLTENPAPGKDTAILMLTPPNSTLTRPGSKLVFWSVKNTSDHPLDLTINLVVTGPCGFRQEHPVHLQLNNGAGFVGRQATDVAFSQANCAGGYTLELRAESSHRLLSRAWAPLKVL